MPTNAYGAAKAAPGVDLMVKTIKGTSNKLPQERRLPDRPCKNRGMRSAPSLLEAIRGAPKSTVGDFWLVALNAPHRIRHYPDVIGTQFNTVR